MDIGHYEIDDRILCQGYGIYSDMKSQEFIYKIQKKPIIQYEQKRGGKNLDWKEMLPKIQEVFKSQENTKELIQSKFGYGRKYDVPLDILINRYRKINNNEILKKWIGDGKKINSEMIDIYKEGDTYDDLANTEKEVMLAIFNTPLKYKFFYEGGWFFLPGKILSRENKEDDYFIFLKYLSGKITWETGETCLMKDGDFFGCFYFIDSSFNGMYIDGIFDGTYTDSFGLKYEINEVPFENLFTNLGFLNFACKVADSNKQKGETNEQQLSIQNNNTQQNQQQPQLSIQNNNTQQNQQQQQMKTNKKQQSMSVSSNAANTSKQRRKKRRSSRFLTRFERQQNKKKNNRTNELDNSENSSATDTLSSVNEIIENYLNDEIMSIASPSDPLIANLTEFINKCSASDTDVDRKILNNRRKLIFQFFMK